MKKLNYYVAALSCAIGISGMANAAKVHTIGDSTMAEYEESRVTRGWGMFLQQFLEGWTVNNRGKAGSSSRTFYEGAAYWASVKSQMTAGDYVFIQFAHNDEKSNGADGDSLIAYYNSVGDATSASSTVRTGTLPYDSYKYYLCKYVEETRALGCTPVLVGPICRMYFSGNTIRRNGRHDLGDSFTKITDSGVTTGNSIPESDHTMDYVYQMKSVADSLGVTFLDLTTATKELFESYGDTKCHELLSDGDGSTHLNTTGAALVARLCAQLMKDNGVLADNVVLTSDLSVSPSEADLGKAYTGQTLTKEFSLSGFSLSPEEGTVSVTASDGFQVSTDKSTWSQTLSVSYNAGTVITSVFAQCELTEAGEKTGTITFTQGAKTVEVPVTATAVTLEGGQDVLVYWRLEKDDSYELTGPAVVFGETMSNMYVQRYASPNSKATWPEETGWDASRKTQRCLINGDAWPAGEIDEVYDRYIEFGVAASKGTVLRIDSIGLYVCGAGGNGMRCHINYSTEPYFANEVNFYAPDKMVANTMTAVSVQPVIELTESDTLRVRIYPWYNGSATGKTICISDVTIHGSAVDASTDGITSATAAKPSETAFFSIDGTRLSAPRRGVNIVRSTNAEGTVQSRKIIYK